MRRLAAAATALLALACAHGGSPAGPAFAFPGAFDANQLVEIRTAGETREVLASLRRRGGDFDVTLFDPVFAVPLLSASSRGGAVHVEAGPAPGRGPGPEEATQLLSLLADLYGRTFRAAGADRFETSSGRFRFGLVGVRPRDGCPFPDRIEVSPRLGSAVHLRVDTIEVSCVPPGGTGQ